MDMISRSDYQTIDSTLFEIYLINISFLFVNAFRNYVAEHNLNKASDWKDFLSLLSQVYYRGFNIYAIFLFSCRKLYLDSNL